MKEHEKHIYPSPMMTEQGKKELYQYSVNKMKEEYSNNGRVKLTNLFSLKSFFYHANECMKNHSELNYAAIRMDIYRFKTVNEFRGREQGDKLLKYIADCFRVYESENCVVGHLRADIFAICVPFKDKQELVQIVQDIDLKIREYTECGKIIASFGICIASGRMDISLMCDYANMALKRIKGKVYIKYAFYDDDMRGQMLWENEIENSVMPALANEEFKVYIQPKVDMRDGRIVGGEALVRWNSRQKGFIYPDQFIPVLEKSGSIVDVDMFVWEKIFAFIKHCKEHHIQVLPISINVSRDHVYQEMFVDTLCSLSDQYQVAPELVPLEITESVFTECLDKLYYNINALQKKGFRFSMDDFGSGYSSLNMLKNEPVDEVKIDRAFLLDIEQEKSRIVIRNVVNMISELGIDMIVEGIETKEQAELLMSYGCNFAQGYYYYKPMPIEEFLSLIENTCNKI